MIIHPFDPVFNSSSKFLILGTFPSVKSRENDFYYGHPQNRFWKVLCRIFNEDFESLKTIENKKSFLLKNNIALWDVIKSCEIIGSSDSSIKNVEPNNLSVILDATPVKKIFCNGSKAYTIFKKYILNQGFSEIEIPVQKLPSTSPANAAWSLENLTKVWTKSFNL